MRLVIIIAGLAIGIGINPLMAQDLELEDVIDGAMRRDSITRAEVGAMKADVESYVRSLEGDGEVKEEKKFIKTYYYKDSLFKVEFHEYYKDGEQQSEKDMRKEAEKAAERRAEGSNRDASVDPRQPFYPENRQHYAFTMPGIEMQHGCVCYHVEADCLMEDEDFLEGDYWFEINDLNLVHAEFRPAKMPSKIKQMDMTKSYAPLEHGYWLPVGFYLRGRGQALIFFKFNFEVQEIYSLYKINLGLDDDFFKEDGDED